MGVLPGRPFGPPGSLIDRLIECFKLAYLQCLWYSRDLCASARVLETPLQLQLELRYLTSSLNVPRNRLWAISLLTEKNFNLHTYNLLNDEEHEPRHDSSRCSLFQFGQLISSSKWQRCVNTNCWSKQKHVGDYYYLHSSFFIFVHTNLYFKQLKLNKLIITN